MTMNNTKKKKKIQCCSPELNIKFGIHMAPMEGGESYVS